jgi:hypothetical protein
MEMLETPSSQSSPKRRAVFLHVLQDPLGYCTASTTCGPQPAPSTKLSKNLMFLKKYEHVLPCHVVITQSSSFCKDFSLLTT